jgi:hypothetical protein
MSCAVPTEPVATMSADPEASRSSAGNASPAIASHVGAHIGTPRPLVRCCPMPHAPMSDDAWARVLEAHGVPERTSTSARWLDRMRRWLRAHVRRTSQLEPRSRRPDRRSDRT